MPESSQTQNTYVPGMMGGPGMQNMPGTGIQMPAPNTGTGGAPAPGNSPGGEPQTAGAALVAAGDLHNGIRSAV